MNDEYTKYQHPFFNQGTVEPFNKDVTQISTDEESAMKRAARDATPTKVQFPEHLFVPFNAQSIDIRRAPLVVAGTTEDILNYVAPIGGVSRFLAYAVYSDGNNAADYEFIPKINGRRVLPYHGDPDNNYKINLGLAPDLSNNSLIQCQLALNPGERLVWTLVNNSAFDTPMGVRMVGYLDTTQRRSNERVGG